VYNPAVARFLIVDDDPVVGDTFARMLRLDRHDVVVAQSAAAGLETALRDLPDAILLDLRMPISGGLEFLRNLRRDARLRELPVAVITGDYFLSPPALDELRALGATVRYKPLWMDDLTALVGTLLTSRTTH
jgi:chemosensory pili system protein ChpA (sensor histidine kinase/response regulator)